MPQNEHRFAGIRLLVGIACLVIVVGGLKAAKGMLIPFMFGVFLAIISSGVVFFLRRIKVPAVISVLFVAIAIFIIFSGIGALIASTIDEFAVALPKYKSKFSALYEALLAYLAHHGLGSKVGDLSKFLDPSSVFDLTGTLIRGIVSVFSDTLLVTVIMVFVLLEATSFKRKISALKESPFNQERLEATAIEIQRYLAIKTLTSAITGASIFVLDSLLGIDFPFLWGFLAFVLNYIPFIGSIIAAIPAVALALLIFGYGTAIACAVGYLAINIGVSNFLEPILMGRRLGLSPLVVFLSLVFWGWTWGPSGMLMSVPLTMIVKIILEHSDDLYWIAVLMDLNPKQKR